MIDQIENIKQESAGDQVTKSFQETPDIETSSGDYASRFSGKVGEWFLRVQERATLKMLSEWPNATILDVGGGHGQLTGPLLARGYNVTIVGSDSSCQTRIKQFTKANNCKFEIGNLLDLPFENKSFDIVISFRLLPHIEQWHRLIEELSRVARKAVIVDYPTVKSINYLTPMLFKLKKKFEGNTRHYRTFSESEILQAFEQHGYRRSGRYAEFFLPMVLHRALKLPFFSSFLEGVFRAVGFTYLFGSPVILKMVRSKG